MFEVSSPSGSGPSAPFTQNPELLLRPMPHFPSPPRKKDRPPYSEKATPQGAFKASEGGVAGAFSERSGRSLASVLPDTQGPVAGWKAPFRPVPGAPGSQASAPSPGCPAWAPGTLASQRAYVPLPSPKLTLPIFHYRIPMRRQLPVLVCGSGLQGRD